MVISSFISSILVLVLGIWAYLKLESSMNIVAEKQLLIEPNKFSYKMWKDMPVTMYQSFTFFNLTNWQQVKSIGSKPRFVEVGPYVYRTIWTKSDINFIDEEKLVSFSEKKQWIFQPHLSQGSEDDQIWTINTPLMTALALIQNAPVITRNIVSVILDGLGEGAFIKRNIRSLLFEGYSDLIVSVGPLFDRRFSNFNGKFAYLYNKNDSVDGIWTVSTGTDDMSNLNKITRFQSNIVNMTSFSSGFLPQGLNEVKPECARAWSLDQSTNGQLFSPFNKDTENSKLLSQQQQQEHHHSKQAARVRGDLAVSSSAPAPAVTPKRFFIRSASNHDHNHNRDQQQDLVPNPFLNSKFGEYNGRSFGNNQVDGQGRPAQLKDFGKFIFYPDLCRPIHLLPSRQKVSTSNGIQASRYYIDPRVLMNSSQVPSNKCYEMNPRPALANALAATINSVTGANVGMPNLVTGASSPFTMFSPPGNHHHHSNHHSQHGGHGNGVFGSHNNEQASNHHGAINVFERTNNPASSFLNSALHTLSAGVGVNVGGGGGGGNGGANSQDQQTSSSNNAPVSRLGRVRQLFSNIVSQRMSATGPGSLLPSLAAVPAGLLMGNHFGSSQARNSPDEPSLLGSGAQNANSMARQQMQAGGGGDSRFATAAAGANNLDGLQQGSSNSVPIQSAQPAPAPVGGSDRWITQFRFKWPRGVFSIGQCQLGAPIYASLPHFLDADEFYLEQVDGLKPNRSLHEFYIDIESTLHSVPVGAKARLQLNVATPELRFRNIPNAMIPVLWQEVTFDIDKSVATMLYWSFTMSPTIYKLISLLLLGSGIMLLILSLVAGFKQHNLRCKWLIREANGSGDNLSGGGSSGATTASQCDETAADNHHQLSCSPASSQAELESRHSTWYSMQADGANNVTGKQARLCASGVGAVREAAATIVHHSAGCVLNGNNDDDELRHRAAFNHGFSLCPAEQLLVHDIGKRFCCADIASAAAATVGLGANGQHQSSTPTKKMMTTTGGSCRSSSSSRSSCHGPISTHSVATTNGTEAGSPKQPSSRASSHCELVVRGSTLTRSRDKITNTTIVGTVDCPGCLLACLRHQPNQHNYNHNHHRGHENLATMHTGSIQRHLKRSPSASDKSIVRQQKQIITTNTTMLSDIDDRQASFVSSSSSPSSPAPSPPSTRESNLDSCSSIYTTEQQSQRQRQLQQQQKHLQHQQQQRQSGRTGTFK